MNIRVAALMACSVVPSFASGFYDVGSCVQDTLYNYIVGERTCQIGSLVYSNFSFQELSVPLTPTYTGNISASDLIVDPQWGLNTFFLLPSPLSIFNRTIVVPERYMLSYFIDPPPIIAGDELSLDPPFGKIWASKWGCLDSSFIGGNPEAILQSVGGRTGYAQDTFQCSSTTQRSQDPYLLQADGTDPGFANVFDSITFPQPAATIDVRLVLDFEPGEIVGFEGIQSQHRITSEVPEPATNALIAAGLAALFTFSKKKLKG